MYYIYLIDELDGGSIGLMIIFARDADASIKYMIDELDSCVGGGGGGIVFLMALSRRLIVGEVSQHLGVPVMIYPSISYIHPYGLY